eukprot:Clim_evm60s191 gene=Clim_evmTU60s191
MFSPFGFSGRGADPWADMFGGDVYGQPRHRPQQTRLVRTPYGVYRVPVEEDDDDRMYEEEPAQLRPNRQQYHSRTPQRRVVTPQEQSDEEVEEVSTPRRSPNHDRRQIPIHRQVRVPKQQQKQVRKDSASKKSLVDALERRIKAQAELLRQRIAARKIQRAWRAYQSRLQQDREVMAIDIIEQWLLSIVKRKRALLAKKSLQTIHKIRDDLCMLRGQYEMGLLGRGRNEKGVSKNLLWYEELLTKKLVALDSIETHGNDVVRSKRKRVVKYIQKELARIDEMKNLPFSSEESDSSSDDGIEKMDINDGDEAVDLGTYKDVMKTDESKSDGSSAWPEKKA